MTLGSVDISLSFLLSAIFYRQAAPRSTGKAYRILLSPLTYIHIGKAERAWCSSPHERVPSVPLDGITWPGGKIAMAIRVGPKKALLSVARRSFSTSTSAPP